MLYFLRMGRGGDALRAAVEKTLGGDLAFGATVGVLDATVSAAEAAVGPHTVDVQDLPPLPMGGERDAGQDLVVRGVLGEGGMGIVELAEQRSLQRDVAIKRAKAEGDPRRFAALLQEAVFTGYLEHPSIVPVHALGRDGDG